MQDISLDDMSLEQLKLCNDIRAAVFKAMYGNDDGSRTPGRNPTIRGSNELP